MAQYENAQKQGVTMGVIPAVDRGEMFFHDGYRMYALHVESGVPLAGITVSAAAPSAGDPDSDDPRPGPAKDLDDEARRRIAVVPGVASVSAVVAAPVLVVFLGGSRDRR